MRTRPGLRAATAALSLTVAASLGLMASSAGAAQSWYPSSHGERFHSGAHGWTSSVRHRGICIEGLTCPKIDNTASGTGGAAGGSDGFIRTAASGLTSTSIITASSGTWASPAFRYTGLDSKRPSSLTFSISRRADLAALAQLGGVAKYSVVLADRRSGKRLTVVDGKRVTDDSRFASIPSVRIDPRRLHVGHRYSIQITTEFRADANVLPAASVDYDNVVLKATGHRGRSGGAGGRHGGGAHGASTRTAVILGNRLYLRSHCERHGQTQRCRRSFTAVRHRHGPRASTTAHARIKRGRTRTVSVRVKHGYAKRLEQRSTVLIRQRTIKRGGGVNTRYVRYHLKHG